MTDDEFLQLCEKTHASVQDENGIDVTQIDYVLSLTPTQRLAELEQFLEEIDALTAGGEITNGEAEGNP